jgi:hypothetical protein
MKAVLFSLRVGIRVKCEAKNRAVSSVVTSELGQVARAASSLGSHHIVLSQNSSALHSARLYLQRPL